MINVMGKTITREEAQELFEKLRAQLDQPEFWPGQLLSVNNERGRRCRKFSHYTDSGKAVDEGGCQWDHAEPLNDPLIWQFKPHKPGDVMPCYGGLNVRALYPGERTICNRAEWADWNNAVGWMPAGGWK